MRAMEFSIQILLRSRTFLGTAGLLAIANVFSWLRHRISPICCDQEMTVGFPVPFYISGGVAGLSNFYLLGLLLDITITLTLAVLATWFTRLFSR